MKPKGRKYSGGKKCCIENCKNREKRRGHKINQPKLKFHRFPKDIKKTSFLIPNMNIEDIKKYKGKRICSEHWVTMNTNKRLLQDEFINSEEQLPPIHSRDLLYFPEDSEVGNTVYIDLNNGSEINISNVTKKVHSQNDDESDHMYYQRNKNIDKIKNLQDHITKLESENEHLKKYAPTRRVDDILNNRFYLNFYTNFPDLKQYNIFVNEIIKHCKSFEVISKKRIVWSQYKLDVRVQIFIVLVRLRLGLLESDIAFRFDVNQSTVCRIFQFWVNVMYSYMIQLPIWPSRDLVQRYMPECFKNCYPSTRKIVDCTEIFIQKPSDYVVQSSTYSSYKSHNTAKGLVGITPNGFLCFVSELYSGRMSDKEVVVMSGVLKKMEAGDSIMADRGFNIVDEVKKYDLDLNIPPFAQEGVAQFSAEDEQQTRDIASVRIHIERAIGNIKSHRILHQIVPNTMADKLNQIWVICCYITNFTHIPLLNRNPVEIKK